MNNKKKKLKLSRKILDDLYTSEICIVDKDLSGVSKTFFQNNLPFDYFQLKNGRNHGIAFVFWK